MMKILLDPGHREGYNSGCNGTYKEGSRMFELSNYLKSELELFGFFVGNTRGSIADNPDVNTRGRMAVLGGYNIFISLHTNACGTQSACGAVTYRSATASLDAISFANQLNEVVAKIINAGTGVTYSRGSATRIDSKGNDYYGVIRNAVGGSVKYNVLIEHAFHTNPKECNWLDNSTNLRALARGMAVFIANYFGVKYEKPAEPTTDLHPICGTSVATAEQMYAYLKRINPDAPDYAKLFLEEGFAEGIRGDIAFAQSCHETGHFKFGGTVKPEQNNFAGIGTTSTTNLGAFFPTPRDGVRAQIQHLKAYACKNLLCNPCIDPRFHLVSRGVAPNVEDLGGRWAVPGYDRKKYSSLEEAKSNKATYGHAIMNILGKILEEKKTKPEPSAPVTPPVVPQEPPSVPVTPPIVPPAPTKESIRVGSDVYFSGNKHYRTANDTNGLPAGRGPAKVSIIKPGNLHPYMIIHSDNTSNVYGWVDEADIGIVGAKKPIVIGCKVKVLNSTDYTGRPFKLYYDTYDVVGVNGDRIVIGVNGVITAAVNACNLMVL